MTDVLLTGARGVVGSRLVKTLRAQGLSVVATSHSAGNESLGLDVTDASAVRTMLEREQPRVVVHLAAIAHRRRKVSDAEYHLVNHTGTANVLAGARAAGVSRVVHFSSSVVYGDLPAEGAIREDAPHHPVGAYAISKAAAEDECFAAERDGLICHVLRFPAIYDAAWLLDVRKRVYLPGSGNRIALRVSGSKARFSLCHVENACAVVLHAIRGRLPSGPVNVADRDAYAQAEIAAVLERIDGPKPHLTLSAPFMRKVFGLALWPVPGATAARVWAMYHKLFSGGVLDLERLLESGFVPQRRLAHLLPDM